MFTLITKRFIWHRAGTRIPSESKGSAGENKFYTRHQKVLVKVLTKPHGCNESEKVTEDDSQILPIVSNHFFWTGCKILTSTLSLDSTQPTLFKSPLLLWSILFSSLSNPEGCGTSSRHHSRCGSNLTFRRSQILLNLLSFGCSGINSVLGPVRPACIATSLLAIGVSWCVHRQSMKHKE